MLVLPVNKYSLAHRMLWAQVSYIGPIGLPTADSQAPERTDALLNIHSIGNKESGPSLATTPFMCIFHDPTWSKTTSGVSGLTHAVSGEIRKEDAESLRQVFPGVKTATSSSLFSFRPSRWAFNLSLSEEEGTSNITGTGSPGTWQFWLSLPESSAERGFNDFELFM